MIIHAYIHTYRQTDRQTCRHADVQTDIPTNIQTYRDTDRQTDIHMTYVWHTYRYIHTDPSIHACIHTYAYMLYPHGLTIVLRSRCRGFAKYIFFLDPRHRAAQGHWATLQHFCSQKKTCRVIVERQLFLANHLAQKLCWYTENLAIRLGMLGQPWRPLGELLARLWCS